MVSEDHIHVLMRRTIETLAKRERDALEAMCERMLTTPGSPGISVQRTFNFRENYVCDVITKLDPAVPFGEIHYLPDIYE